MKKPKLKQLEREKYERVWGITAYREQSDGWPVVRQALLDMGCVGGESVIDWGCGAGHCTEFIQQQGMAVVGFDIASNCLSRWIKVPLVVGTLWEAPPGLMSDYAFCTDVLEHIPPRHIMRVLDMIAERTRKAAFIQVDTEHDISGKKMNPPEVLHLCVKPNRWWRKQLTRRWSSVIENPGAFSRWCYLCRK